MTSASPCGVDCALANAYCGRKGCPWGGAMVADTRGFPPGMPIPPHIHLPAIRADEAGFDGAMFMAPDAETVTLSAAAMPVFTHAPFHQGVAGFVTRWQRHYSFWLFGVHVSISLARPK